MFATFVAWSLTQAGLSVWEAVAVCTLLGAAMGGVVERTVMRSVMTAPLLSALVVTLGLFSLLNGAATWVWAQGPLPKKFPTVSSFAIIDLGFARVSAHHVGLLAAAAGLMLALWLFFNFTRLGLALRATSENPASARLVGINIDRMRSLGWLLSTGLGTLAGMLMAPVTLLWPGFMFGVFLYAMAAATAGGLASPPGTVAAALIIGVAENLLGTYTPAAWLGPEMSCP